MDVRLKRAYEPAAASDGYRILMDRIWPAGSYAQRRRTWTSGRGSSRRAASCAAGLDTILPAFEEFWQRYTVELEAQEGKLLRGRAREGTLALVYSARDTEHNDALVLAEILRRGRRSP
jgi:uncharacterized protein YeaO (DUF488 family)